MAGEKALGWRRPNAPVRPILSFVSPIARRLRLALPRSTMAVSIRLVLTALVAVASAAATLASLGRVGGAGRGEFSADARVVFLNRRHPIDPRCFPSFGPAYMGEQLIIFIVIDLEKKTELIFM